MQMSKQQIREVITAAAEEHGVNPEVLYKMAAVESNFKADAVSPKGAQGWFQFMPATAKSYGVDDPTDLTQAAKGAAKYMADNLKKYNGDYELALVDYNGGPRAVKAYSKGNGFAESIGYTQKILGDETVRGSLRGRAPVVEVPSAGATRSITGGNVYGTDSPTRNADPFSITRASNIDAAGKTWTNLPERLSEAVSLGFKTENSAYAFLTRTPEESDIDLDFVLTDEVAKQYAADIPEDNREYVLSGGSLKAIQARRERYLAADKDRQELYKLGAGPALTGTLLGAGLDIPTLVGFIPLFGQTATVARGSRLVNAGINAVAAGAAGGVAEAVAGAYRPLQTQEDIMFAAIASGVFGGIGGGLAKLSPVVAPDANDLTDAIRRQANRELGGEVIPPAPSREVIVRPRDAAIEGEVLPPLEPTGLPGQRALPFDMVEGEGRFVDDAADGIEGPRGLPAPARDTEPAGMTGPLGIKEPRKEVPEEAVEPTVVPEKGVLPPPPKEEPVAPKKPKADPWKPEWNTPKFTTGMNARLTSIGNKRTLRLPELDKVGDLVEYIMKFSQNDAMKEILKKIGKVTNLKGIRAEIMGGGFSAAGAVTWRGANATSKQWERILKLKRGEAGFNEETLTHELIHYVTGWHIWAAMAKRGVQSSNIGFMVDLPEDLLKTLDPKKVQVGEELIDLWLEARKQLAGTSTSADFKYGLSDPHEFMTMGMTNREFQEALKSMKFGTSKKTVWNAFVEKLSNLLGISKGQSNAFKELVSIFERIADDSAEVAKFEKRSGRGKSKGVDSAQPMPEVELFAKNNPEVGDSVFGFGMGMEDRLMNKNIPKSVRVLAGKLFGTTKGYKDKAIAVGESVWDLKLKLQNGWRTKVNKAGYAGFNKYKMDGGYKLHEEFKAKEDFQKDMYRLLHGRVTEADVHPGVVEAVKEWRATMRDVVDNINNPAKATGGQKRGMTQRVTKDENGNDVLSDPLDYNDNYIPRVIDMQKWHQMANEFGREFMNDFFAQSFKRARPEMDDERAELLGKWYVQAVEKAKLNQNEDLLDAALAGQDMQWLAQSLREVKIDEDIIKQLLNDLNPATKGAVNNSNLKFRSLLDETLEVTGPDGRTISFEDFFDTNVMNLGDRYFSRMAGSISLANKLDIYDGAGEANEIAKALERELGTTIDDGLKRRMEKDLKFAFDRIMNRPMEDLTKFSKSAEMFRNYNVATKMSMAVLNQIQELSQILGTMGLKATLAAVPELRKFMRDARTGKLGNDMLNQLEEMIDGAGNDLINRIQWAPNNDWVRTFGDSTVNQWLDKADTASRFMADGVLKVTGMTGLMSQQKRLHAIAFINHFHAAALGKKKLAFSADRLAWMGLNPEDSGKILGSLKTYTKQKANGRVDTVDFVKWQSEDPDSFSKFMTAFQREARRTVQENDLASMVPFMGTTLGQTFFQFMNFVVQAWNKQMMFAANYRDIETVQTMLWGTMMSAMTYTFRTYQQAQGRSEEEKQKFLEENLALDKVVLRSVGRIAQASLIPSFIDTLSPVPLFSGMRTTTEKTDLLANPTTDLISTAMATAKRIGKAAAGEESMSEADYRAALKMLPMSNAIGVSSVLNNIAADLAADVELE
jgi:hypothetical protein